MNKYFCSISEQLSNTIQNTSNIFIDENMLNVGTASRFSPLAPEQLIKTVSKFQTSEGFRVHNVSSFFSKKGMPVLPV